MPDIIETLRNRLASDSTESATLMPNHKGGIVSVTVAELKEACKLYPEHPAALVYATLKGDTSRKVNVNTTDLDCLISNCEIISTSTKDAKGRETITKSKGSPLNKPKAVAPAKSVDPSGAPK